MSGKAAVTGLGGFICLTLLLLRFNWGNCMSGVVAHGSSQRKPANKTSERRIGARFGKAVVASLVNDGVVTEWVTRDIRRRSDAPMFGRGECASVDEH